MRTAGIVMAALLVLAAAQAAAALLYALLLAALVFGLFVCPRETLDLLALGIVAGLVRSCPLACLGLAALVTVAKILGRSRWPP